MGWHLLIRINASLNTNCKNIAMTLVSQLVEVCLHQILIYYLIFIFILNFKWYLKS